MTSIHFELKWNYADYAGINAFKSVTMFIARRYSTFVIINTKFKLFLSGYVLLVGLLFWKNIFFFFLDENFLKFYFFFVIFYIKFLAHKMCIIDEVEHFTCQTVQKNPHVVLLLQRKKNNAYWNQKTKKKKKLN